MEKEDVPDLHEWLLAQTHREDLVGTLARSCVEKATGPTGTDFTAWLAGMEAGLFMRPVIEDAKREYDVCVRELLTEGHSRSFPLICRAIDPQAQDASWAKHKAEPAKSVETYLHELHKDLRREVESVTRLYLDTNHWIRLTDVVIGKAPPGDRYAELLVRLRALRAAGKLVCPLSFPLFHELTTQSDPKTRRPMAALMDELSGGVAIQPPNELEKIELKRQILRSVLGAEAPDLGEWIWVKASAVLGERIAVPLTDGWSAEVKRTLQKVMLDSTWAMPLAALVEFPIPPTRDHLSELAEAYVKDADDYRRRGVKFEQVLQEQKAIYGGGLMKNSMRKLAEEVRHQFPLECAAYEANGGGNQAFDPNILASIQIKASVFASFIVSTHNKKIIVNDVVDAIHVSMALPHCDAACVDRGMAHRLTSPPLSFDRVYRAKVFFSPDEVLKWLNAACVAGDHLKVGAGSV